MMRVSGYDQFYREKILRGVHDRIKQVEIEILKGRRPRYRNREQIKEGHLVEKGRYNNTWFLKGGGEYTSVLVVQPTPNGELAKNIREKIGGIRAPDGGKTKVVELGGDVLTKGLFKGDPFRKSGCPFDRTCGIDKKGNCMQQKAIYELRCKICMEIKEEAERNGNRGEIIIATYRGQSGCSCHKRCLEHMDAIRRGDGSSGMAQHIREAHTGIDMTRQDLVEMSIIQHRPKNMERGIAEAVLIEQSEKEMLEA